MTGQSRALTSHGITASPARTLFMLAMMALVVGVLSGCAPRGYFNAFSPQTAPLSPSLLPRSATGRHFWLLPGTEHATCGTGVLMCRSPPNMK